jgi:hypothetical protein
MKKVIQNISYISGTKEESFRNSSSPLIFTSKNESGKEKCHAQQDCFNLFTAE